MDEEELFKFDPAKQKELDDKSAIIANALSANSAATEGKVDDITSQDAASFKKKMDAQAEDKKQKDKFDADKQSALDQGYTEEQAIKFAKQEELAGKQARQQLASETVQTDQIPPEEGVQEKPKPKPKKAITPKKAAPKPVSEPAAEEPAAAEAPKASKQEAT